MGFGALDKTSLFFGTVTDKIQVTSSGNCEDIAAGDDGITRKLDDEAQETVSKHNCRQALQLQLSWPPNLW